MSWFDHRKRIWLRFVVEIEAHRSVATGSDAGGMRPIHGQPHEETSMRAAVLDKPNWRRHVYDSFDKLRLLDLWHGMVAPLKLVACEMVPLFERRNS